MNCAAYVPPLELFDNIAKNQALLKKWNNEMVLLLKQEDWSENIENITF